MSFEISYCMAQRYRHTCKENNHREAITCTNVTLPTSQISIRNEQFSLKNWSGMRIIFIISFHSHWPFTILEEQSQNSTFPSRTLINRDKVCFHFFQRLEWEMLKYHMKDLACRVSSWSCRQKCWKFSQGIQASWHFQTNPVAPGDRGKCKVSFRRPGTQSPLNFEPFKEYWLRV